MKKYLIALILSGVSLLGFGQDIQFGLKAGATLGYFDNEGKEYDYGDPKLGFTLGGIGRFKVSDDFFIKSELGFSQITTGLESSEYYIRVNRIDLMLLAGYRVSEKFDIEIGPEVNYLISAPYKSRLSSGNFDFEKNINLGISVGSNFRINDHFGINARYSIGLIYYDNFQLIDENQNAAGVVKTDRVSYLSLGVNYYFKN